MSSVSSSDSNNPSKLREYYSRREVEVDDKHHTEVANLKKTQAEEMDHLREQASSQIDEAKNRIQEKITDQDKKHTQDIEALKAIYQKKLENANRNKA